MEVKLDVNKQIICKVCPHVCSLAEGQYGRCRARVARNGVVQCDSYARVTSLALDPMEKKPLVRFMPDTYVASVGSYGCNLACPFCQNASIAYAGAHEISWITLPPEALVEYAAARRPQGCVGIAYTYNEPLIGYEYVRDTGQLAHDAGLVNVIVSNGMINAAPLAELLPFLDAANIDLKGFTQEFYDLIEGNLKVVQRTVRTLVECPSCHVEVTTLVIPGLNDRPEEIDAVASWLASLDADIPYHLTRFFPHYYMTDRPPTPRKTLEELALVARRHLHDVVLGNC